MKNVVIGLVACAAWLGSLAAHASCANTAPSSILNLSHWKLTLPVDEHHGTSGEAAEISTRDLLNGYRSGYFCANPAGGVKFWAPVDGATTDGSEYPRSELRYMIDPDDHRVNWAPDETSARLSARLVVERVPSSTRKVVVGQIHGFETKVYVMLRYQYHPESDSGSVAAMVNEDPSSPHGTNYGEVFGLPNGQPFTYSIAVANREITVKVNGHPLTAFHVQHGWLHVPMYFKAGSYTLASGSSSTDGGRVTIYSLGGSVHADGDPDAIFASGLD